MAKLNEAKGMYAVAHIAIGCKSLLEAKKFYECLPECIHTRSYEDRECFNFWGIQLTVHLSPNKTPKVASHYPYHFGVNIPDYKKFKQLSHILIDLGLDPESGVRFKGSNAEHNYLSFPDPSNNCIEFKYYPALIDGY